MSKLDASVSCIISTTEVLWCYLESQVPNTRGIQTLRKTMLGSLERRFAAMEERREVVLTCKLDPRYKQEEQQQDQSKQGKESHRGGPVSESVRHDDMLLSQQVQ